MLVSLCFELLKSWRSIFHWPIWLKLYRSLCPRWGLEVFNFVVISPTHRHHHMFIQQFQQQTPHRPHMGLCCLLILTFNSLCCWSKYVLQWRVITFYLWSVLCPVDWNNKWQMDLRCVYYRLSHGFVCKKCLSEIRLLLLHAHSCCAEKETCWHFTATLTAYV